MAQVPDAHAAGMSCTNCVLTRISIGVYSIPIDGSITYDPASNTLAVSCNASCGGLTLIDGATDGAAELIGNGVGYSGFVYDPPARGLLGVGVNETSEVGEVDLLNGTTGATVGSVPWPLNRSSAGGLIVPLSDDMGYDALHGWITSWPGTNLIELNATTGSWVRTVGEGYSPLLALTTANGTVVTAWIFSGLIDVLQDTSGLSEFQLNVSLDPLSMAYDPSASEVFVAGNNAAHTQGYVEAVNLTTRAVTHEVEVGFGPEGMVYDPANGNLYVADTGSSEVSVVNTTTWTATVNIPTDPFPGSIAFDSQNGCLYVLTSTASNSGGSKNEVSVLAPPGAGCPVPAGAASWGVDAIIVLGVALALVVALAVIALTRRREKASPPKEEAGPADEKPTASADGPGREVR